MEPTHWTKLPERNLDVMRAIAVLLVVFDHGIYASPWVHAFPFDPWILGRLGVLFFFVHTSLVLMSSIERHRGNGKWVRAFYVRRAFRIYPLAIVCILAAVMLSVPPHVAAYGVVMHPAIVSRMTLLSNLLLAQNLNGAPNIIGVLWSLPLEMQMYLFLPVCYLIARRKVSDLMLMVLFFVIMGYAVFGSQIRGVWRLNVFVFGPCFCGGVIAYHLLYRGTPARIAPSTWVPALVAVAVGFVALRPNAEHPLVGWLPCLVLGVLIPQVRDLSKSTLTSLAKWVAKYSYGIYLVHVPLLWLWMVVLRDLPAEVRWAGWFATTLGVSMILFKLIEQPMIRMGGRIVAPLRVVTDASLAESHES